MTSPLSWFRLGVILLLVSISCTVHADDLEQIVDQYEPGDQIGIETSFEPTAIPRRVIAETEESGTASQRNDEVPWQGQDSFSLSDSIVVTIGAALVVQVTGAVPFVVLGFIPLYSELRRRWWYDDTSTLGLYIEGTRTALDGWLGGGLSYQYESTIHPESVLQDQSLAPFSEVQLPSFDPMDEQIDPFADSVQDEVSAVYRWSPDWDPAVSDAWLQCTSYVAMVYELNGYAMEGRLVGDAAAWITNTETFQVRSVDDSSMISFGVRPLDTVVWTDSVSGHVGIVVEVANGIVTVANANAPRAVFQFRQVFLHNGSIQLIPLTGQGVSKGWQPSHILRPREQTRRSDSRS